MAAGPARPEPVLRNGRGHSSERPAYQKKKKKYPLDGNSLAFQWLGLNAFTSGDPGLIPGRGTRIPQAMRYSPPSNFFFSFFFLRYAGLLLLWPLPLRSTGSGRAGPAAMAHGPSRSAACGILPDQGTNPCPLHRRQVDSQPLRHQGSPLVFIFIYMT